MFVDVLDGACGFSSVACARTAPMLRCLPDAAQSHGHGRRYVHVRAHDGSCNQMDFFVCAG